MISFILFASEVYHLLTPSGPRAMALGERSLDIGTEQLSNTAMLPPIPVLNDYGISPDYGFLPTELPLERLPDPYYNKWEAVIANLQGLILSKRLRGVIDRLPVLSTAGLGHDAEWRRAYMMLAFMAQGYIWGGDTPLEASFPVLQDQKPLLTFYAAPAAVDLNTVIDCLSTPRGASHCHICCGMFVELQNVVH